MFTDKDSIINVPINRMLDVLEDVMHLRGIKYARLDGSTPQP